jgi:hypothetical protein
MKRKHFTVEEANRMLPVLRDVVGTIQERLEWLAAHQPGFEFMVRKHRIPTESPVRPDYFERLVQVRSALGELELLGCQLKDVRRGLVDFPARLFGRRVLLCWSLGEETVSHYHDPDSGFAGRQPIPRLDDPGDDPRGEDI